MAGLLEEKAKQNKTQKKTKRRGRDKKSCLKVSCGGRILGDEVRKVPLWKEPSKSLGELWLLL